MGHEDRERKFEQALERHLRRSAAGARNEADALADAPGAAVECPEAETLGAFHEHALSSEEMKATTVHIAVCSRCQDILGQLEATDEVVVADEREQVAVKRGSVLSTGALYVDDAARQSPSLTIDGQPKPILKTPQDISHGRGFKALRWAAPAGAIAAGLLIWIVVRESKVEILRRPDNVQIAQEQPTDKRLATAQPFPTSRAPGTIAKAKQLNEQRKDQSKIEQSAKESGAPRAPKSPSAAAMAYEAGAVTTDTSAQASIRPPPSEYTDHAPHKAAADRPPEILSRQADVSATAAPAPTGDARAQSASASPVGSALPPAQSRGASSHDAKQKAEPNQSRTARTIVNEQSPPATEQVVTNDKLERSKPLKKDSYKNSNIVFARNGTVWWQLLPGGKIERSADRGITWSPQNSGVSVELLMGSAPSDTVCWIIGREGTILKTTDGGGHWNKVAWPGGEIIGIDGTDAMHAIVYDGTTGVPVRLATNDGGVVWFHTTK